MILVKGAQPDQVPTLHPQLAVVVAEARRRIVSGEATGPRDRGFRGPVDVYDPVANAWRSAAPMPTAARGP